MKKALSLVLAAVMAFSLVACGGSSSSTASAGSTGSASGSTTSNVTVQIGPNPESIDPALNSTIDGGNMLITAFEGLLIVDENNQVQPGQAESWEVSEDGLTWTFHLREGLKWSDGTDLDATDFVYTYKRVADPDTAAPYSQTAVGMIAGYDEAMNGNPDALQVEAPDANTFVVHLSYPCTYFDKLAAFATLSPVQQETIEANGDAWATSPETYISNGPYYMTEWTVGQQIVFTKNPYYKGGWDSDKIVTDTITFLLMEDSTAAYTAYTTGQAQLIKDVPTEEIPSLTKAEDGGEFYVDPVMGTYYLTMNDSIEPFNDVNVRKALSLAIDRDYIANTLMQGTYSPAYKLTGPGITDADGSAYMDKSSSEWIPEDYETAKTMAQEALAEAGYPNGEGFPTITYSTNDAGYHKALAEYLQQCYKEVLGINLEIEIVEWSSFTPMRRAGDYEMARNGWSFDYNDPSSMLELFMTGNANNDGQYSNPEFDAMMENTKIADKEQRFENLHAAEEIVMADYSMIPVAYYNDFWLQSPDLQGTWHSPYGYWYLQYAYIGEPAEDTGADSASVTSTAAESTASEAASSEAAESVASETASSEAAESAVSEAASSEAVASDSASAA
ncbi:peptide ABC transporter substrate-binding protein [uncultured Allofournierella sp.]|uniref:peptide ABC transporter substrate-binding protein n=1 Tax=uncultured Allofournierella sp. TaxID=1940258 RepID=UPI0025E8C0CF|nr:peptide ABC transporter substrate-binding protein [uncultured Fournierella sp.]